MYIKAGELTPWGVAENVTMIAAGIELISTPSHGGVYLSPARNAVVPDGARNANRFYEEDSEWTIPATVFAEEFAAATSSITDAHKQAEEAERVLVDWHPSAAEALGLDFDREESYVLREQDVDREHTHDMVVVSAVGDFDRRVPKGWVQVNATLGGDRSLIGTHQERLCLVPEEDYRNRGRRFVVDPANNPRHVAWSQPAQLARELALQPDVARAVLQVLAVDPTGPDPDREIEEAARGGYLVRDTEVLSIAAVRERQLGVVNGLIGGHGIKAIGKVDGDAQAGLIGEYIDRGDESTPSVILDRLEGVFRLESLADFAERLERCNIARGDADGDLRIVNEADEGPSIHP